MTDKEKLEKIHNYVKGNMDENFDFEIEYWDSGNFDDTYHYGLESGEQSLLKWLKKVIEED